MSFELLLAVLVLIVAMNVFGLVSSRGGRSSLHSVAFFSGLLGLLAVPFVVFGFLAAASQLIMVSASSPAGVTFHVSAAVVLLCGLASVASVVAARMRGAAGSAV